MSITSSIVVAVGSLNPVKVGAVRSALTQASLAADVRGVDVPSGVAAMPLGYDETTLGARRRAANALLALHADWGVGLEGGVRFDADGEAWLFSVAAIVTAERETVARGGELLLPPMAAECLHSGAELGPVIDELLGTTNIKQGIGAIGLLTDGLITREDTMRDAFVRALAPLLKPELYDRTNTRT